MFPPQKKPAGPGSKSAGGPPDPFGGGGGDPFGPASAGAPAQPPGMDPFGGGAMLSLGMAPGLPKPGQGMDPMQAMLNGLRPDPLGGGVSQGPPLGPDDLPVGGSLPRLDGDMDEGMDGSSLLQALSGALRGGTSQAGMPLGLYDVNPFQSGQGFQGAGTGDPNMGVDQMLQLLALGQMGVGGGPGVGSSGVDVGSFGNMGQALGY